MISKIFLIFLLVLSVAVGDATQIFKSVRHERRSHRGLKTAIVKESVQHPRLFTHAFLAPPLHASAKASYNFAVDIVDYGSASTFQCIYKQGYNAVFIQGYSPSNGGSVNTNLISNLNNAAVAGLGNEIYVTPTMAKTGQTQFDAVYNQLKNSGVNVRSIWLQVTSPINWGNNVQNNVNLITSFASRANSNGISVGIFTNSYDWQQITGGYTGFSSLRLWYWNNNGQGPNAESPANFDDFRPFAGWTSPAVKQFAVNEALCGLTLNRDVYPLGSKAAAAAKTATNNGNNKVIVGGFI